MIQDSDVEMEIAEEVQNGHTDACNGKTESSNNGYQNGNSHNSNNTCQENMWNDIEEDMGKLS